MLYTVGFERIVPGYLLGELQIRGVIHVVVICAEIIPSRAPFTMTNAVVNIPPPAPGGYPTGPVAVGPLREMR